MGEERPREYVIVLDRPKKVCPLNHLDRCDPRCPLRRGDKCLIELALEALIAFLQRALPQRRA